MTAIDMLPDLTAPAPAPWAAGERGPAGYVPAERGTAEGAALGIPAPRTPCRPAPYPQYWLVGSWSGTEPDELGRAIMERRIYVSPLAGRADHESAVEIISDALCRWAHPDDIRWCHLPDGGTGGYTIVGRAVRAVSVGEGCSLEDEEDLDY